MTMVMDTQHRQFGGIGYDSNIYSNPMHTTSPHFTDPWTAHSAANNTSSLYHSALPTSSLQTKPENARPTNIAMPYSSVPTSAPMSQGSSYPSSTYAAVDSLSHPQDIPRSTYGTDQSYTSTAPPTSSYPSSYSSLNYAQSLQQQQQAQHHDANRRLSNPNDASSRTAHATFGELDSARGMLALSNQNLQQSMTDLTPRNIYEARGARGSTDSYGFPSNTSSTSSFSMGSGRDYNPYYSASVASTDSATDYSSAASDGGYDSMTASRTLPRPQQLLGANLPPAPQSMMGQFSSKMSSNTQKKHKCKVCDKRFTRPSSLQTHMYSHTGEKPYACDVEGCGRHFSVVSNLRRHKKVHKGELDHSHSSEED